MKDFFMAAYPWIITGLCVVVMAAQMIRKRSKIEFGGNDNA
ncbi:MULTISPECIES: hypothetical protein [Anaerostipes]|nr:MULTISPECIES: hypothetical protein [Anaerostipes]MDY2726796.1 hypothetical protein [Anaerostipes faecalis]